MGPVAGGREMPTRLEASDPVTDGELVTVGDRAERATRTAALATRYCASAARRFWLETPTCSSSELSAGSLNISHHFPRRVPSAGWAFFQPSGGSSLKAAGTAAVGFW